jgi:hypothetical protein
MKIYKGKSGINQTYQDEFEENIPCKKCKGNARILFTAIENQNRDLNKNAIATIHENMKDGKYWVHDLIAVSVYLCEKCFEANAELNQA